MMLWHLVFFLLLPLLLLGVPVAFAMLIVGSAGIFLTVGLGPLEGLLAYGPYERVAGYTLSTIPMFILMAEFLRSGRFTKDLYNLSFEFVGHWRGGVSYATLGGGTLLAGISGSSTAAAGSLAAVAFPEMQRLGYDVGFSAALIAVVGTLAIMIPPSLGLILYGVFTETSVGLLLLAGLLPGLLTAIGYAVSIFLSAKLDRDLFPGPEQNQPPSERKAIVRSALPSLCLLAGTLLALYSGIITASEVGALGALAAMLMAICRRGVSQKDLVHAVLRATRASAAVLAIIGLSSVIGVYMALEGTTSQILEAFESSDVPPWAVLALVLALLIVLGMFLDQLAILVLTLPLTFPLLTDAGYDPVWLGIVFVKTAEIGLITPPMGLNVFVVSGVTGTPSSQIFRRIWPFLAVEFLVLLVIIAFPELALWPSEVDLMKE